MNAYEEKLRVSIATLYDVFAPYSLRPHIPGCPHCMSEADSDRLHEQSLRELTADRLGKYVYSAMTTLGNSDDFRHFLPRLLECAVDESAVGWTDLEILIGKLAYGKWHSWPGEEQNAIRQYLMAAWNNVLFKSAKDDDSAWEWICAIGQAEDDLSPYFRAWETMNIVAVNPLVHLFVREGNHLLAKQKLSNSFWSERREQMMQVIEWLASPAVHAILEEAFHRATRTSRSGEISLACTIQEGLTEWRSFSQS